MKLTVTRKETIQPISEVTLVLNRDEALALATLVGSLGGCGAVRTTLIPMYGNLYQEFAKENVEMLSNSTNIEYKMWRDSLKGIKICY